MKKMVIDQEVLCNFCEKEFSVKRDRCMGVNCDTATENYLEEYDISEEGALKTFKDISLGDTLYYIKRGSIPPEFKEVEVTALGFRDSGFYCSVKFNNIEVKFNNIDRKKSSTEGGLFVIKEEALKKFEIECTDRIIKIAKMIGAVKIRYGVN